MNDIILGLFKEAEKNLIKYGALHPCAIIFSTVIDNPYIVDLTYAFSNVDCRNEFYDIFPQMLMDRKAYKIIFISETWVFNNIEKLTQEEIERCLEDPSYARKNSGCEAVQVVELFPDKSLGYYRLFKRNFEGGIVLGDFYESGCIVMDRMDRFQGALLEVY